MVSLVVGTAIIAHGRVLAARRAYPAGPAGRWELPGGKVHEGEQPAQTAVREIREELGCSIEVTGSLDGRQPIDDGLDLVVRLARLVGEEPVPVEHDIVRWLAAEELDELDWLPADRPFLPELRSRLLDGDPLAGGNVGGAVRIGSTVRRPTGSWTPAVHALLAHLRTARVGAVPTVLGVDECGREVLTYLPGRVVDIDREVPSADLLVDAMRWLRSCHDAVRAFRHPGPWRNSAADHARTAAEPGADLIICHHDFAPYNVAVTGSADGERVAGVFDWDMAGPGTRLEDLGFAAWNWVPLFRPLPAADAAARLALMAAGYGSDVSGHEILHAVVPRIERSIRVITAGQLAGDTGMVNLGRAGEPARTVARVEELRKRIPDIEQELST